MPSPHVPHPFLGRRQRFQVAAPVQVGARPMPRVLARDRSRSRIKVFPGRSGGLGGDMRHTVVELPFTELNPTSSGPAGQAWEACRRVLDRLHPAEREVALANLLATFGDVRRGR